ncbi:hypothetical protein [Actinomadura sp. WMMA1423]|uniref:hypothetical protein n=1 Tax=Actinomadura sp. WMMA1423 TaxID=2591108 RepID=UPI00114673CB|nr:hypothetical protein [Actinomadura sp. WMMA1423]
MYESCQPTYLVDGEPVRTRIRVVGDPGDRWLPGYSKVQVVTLLEDGRGVRERSLATRQLYASGVTAAGLERRTGYRLVSGPGTSGAGS